MEGSGRNLTEQMIINSLTDQGEAVDWRLVAENGLEDAFENMLLSVPGEVSGVYGKVENGVEVGYDEGSLSYKSKSWYNDDNTINYPPKNGAVLGTEEFISLMPGDVLGRYGNIGEKSNYATLPGADYNKLSLPPDTDPHIYQEFIVLKEIPKTLQAEIAPWGDSLGGGIQYELPMAIKDLVRQGYIEPKLK